MELHIMNAVFIIITVFFLFASLFIYLYKKFQHVYIKKDMEGETNWKNIRDERPVEGQLCKVYDMFGKTEEMYYKPWPSVTLSDGEKLVVGRDLFYNSRGFLTDDIVYWMDINESNDK